MAYFGVYETCEILLEGQLQRSIEGRARATITSVASFGYETAGIVFYLLGGIGAQLGGWTIGLTVFAALGTLLALAFSVGPLRTARSR